MMPRSGSGSLTTSAIALLHEVELCGDDLVHLRLVQAEEFPCLCGDGRGKLEHLHMDVIGIAVDGCFYERCRCRGRGRGGKMPRDGGGGCACNEGSSVHAFIDSQFSNSSAWL